MLPGIPTALNVLLHTPNNQQVPGMGLRAAVQQLQSRKNGSQHTQLRIATSQNPVELHAVLERHSAAAAAAGLQHHTTPQAFYMAGMQDGTQQQQQHTATSLSQSSLRHRLLQRPSRGALQTPHQQQQQQQQQYPTYQQASTTAPQGSGLHAAPAAVAQSPAAPRPIPGLASASADGHQTSREHLFDEIAAATSLHQLQQLFPHVAAVGLPELTTVLLLQAVRVVRSGEGACLVPVLQPWAQQHTQTGQQDVAGQQQQQWQQPQQDRGMQQEQQWQQVQQQQQQQQQEQQQQGRSGAGSAELQQLLANVNVLLGRQCPMLQFQHISGVLWAWSQLGWRPAEGQAGLGLRSILRRLIECPVQRETSGQHSQVGPQLARAIVGCATLNIKDPAVWQKLHSITQAAAQLLQQRELALCAWGMARSRMPHTTHSIAAWRALLHRAQEITAAAGVGAGAGFDRVAALNLSWAVLVAQVAHLAPASWLGVLVQQALGPSYQSWLMQQEQDTAEAIQTPSSSSGSELQRAFPAAAASVGLSAAGVMGRSSSSAGASGAAVSDLLPQELCCLYWTLTAATKQQQATLDGPSTQQVVTQHGKATAAAPAGAMQQEGKGRAALTAVDKQQLAQLQQQWCRDVRVVLQDQQLQGYLAAAVVQQLQELQPQHISQLARTAAVLHQQQGTVAQSASSTAAVEADVAAAAAASAAGRGADSEGSSRVSQQLGEVLLQQIWERVLQDACSNSLEGYRLADICMLLQSVSAMQQPHLQQQGQQQDGSTAACCSALPAVAADVITAAVQRVQSAHPSELHPRTATLLLHELAVLCRTANRGSSSILQGAVSAAVSAVVVRLAHATCSSGGVAHLQDKELVLAAVAAGQLASAQSAPAPNRDSSGPLSSQSRVLQLLLQQLALPLAAVASSLKLRSLANIACAYAAAGQSPPELFDAVADAVQDSRVLHRGSSWALARTLAAYAAVGYVDEGLFGAVADALLPRLRAGNLRPRVVSKLAAALAAEGYHDAGVFQEIAAVVVATAGRGTKVVPAPQALAAPAAATSTAAAPTGELPAAGMLVQQRAGAVPVGAPMHMPVYAAQDVSNLSWALATAGFKAVEPFEVLAAVGEQQIHSMSTSQVANLLWGCAVAGVKRVSLLAAAASHLTQNIAAAESAGVCSLLSAASASDVATIAWSLAKLGVCDRGVMEECVRHFEAHGQQYSPGDAAGLAWALAWSGSLSTSGVLQSTCSQTLAGLVDQHSCEAPACADSDSSSSGMEGGSRQEGRAAVSARDVLVQLLGVCGSDVDALSPQQLASMGLVQAALQAGCIADHDRVSHTAQSDAGDAGSSGGSSVSGSGSSGVLASGAFCQQLWPNVASWGATAFTAVDGTKLLWASLLAAGQQQQQQQQLKQGPAVKGVDAVRAKLLGAGARALVHQTAAVCSSKFGQQVLTALKALNLTAHPAVQPQQPAGAPIQRRSAGGSAAVTAAAAAAAAAAVTAALAAPSGGHASASSSSSDKMWQWLGPDVTAQLLGHFVVAVPAAAGDQVPLLLHLVAASDLCEPVQGAAAADQQGSVAAADAQGFVEARPQLGWHAVVGGAVLQQQPHYVDVVLTQLDWEAWGEQQLVKLQELLMPAAAGVRV